MKNGKYTVFVSKLGRCDDPTYCLWVDTEDEAIYKRAIRAIEPQGWKLAKQYLPDTELDKPNFTQTINL